MPGTRYAWPRVESSFGRLKKALKAAQKAVALEPNLARTQTILGFAYLTQVKTKQAKDAFTKAIALDQADPSRGWVWGWHKSGRAVWRRAAGTSRLPPAWTPTTP